MKKGDEDVYYSIRSEHRWVFSKLEIAIRAGISAGPGGIPVPEPGYYCVRPVMNIRGMGLGMSMLPLTPESSLELVPPGYFWAEWITGTHHTFDIVDGKVTNVLVGHKSDDDHSFKYWEKVDDKVEIPDAALPLVDHYPEMNVETIAGIPIEIHLRLNPDIRHFKNNKRLYPIWEHKVPANYEVDIIDYEDCDGFLTQARFGFDLTDLNRGGQ